MQNAFMMQANLHKIIYYLHTASFLAEKRHYLRETNEIAIVIFVKMI